VMLFGLIATTGLRVSEAINLRLGDVLPGAVLQIRETKFYKSRLVPLHATVAEALDRYLDIRRHFAGSDDHLFLSMGGKGLHYSTVRSAFHRTLQLANIASGRARRPASTIFVTALRRESSSNAAQSATRLRDTLLRCRPISATPISRIPTGILRRRRN